MWHVYKPDKISFIGVKEVLELVQTFFEDFDKIVWSEYFK